jgi:hypothetical protein
MKRVLSLTLAMIMSVALLAQRGQHTDRSAEDIAVKQAERMKTELNLNETQYASIKAINQKYAKQVIELRKDTAMAREKFHAEMKSIHNDKQEELKRVLSPEQQAKWEANRDHRKEGRRGGKSHADIKDHRKAEMKKALKLSDEQSTKLDAAHLDFKQRASAIREDKSLNDETKKEKVKALKATHETIVKNILSDEQFLKWKEIKKDGNKRGKDHQKRLNKEHHFEK